MSKKTTSSTIPVGDWTYVFLNRPETSHIDYIRFKTPDKAETGIIGMDGQAIGSKEGPIDTLVFGGGTNIRLFYIADDDTVSEAKLPNANLDDTDPKKAWATTGDDLTFESSISDATRTVDSTTFLAASVNGGKPVVVYKPKPSKKTPDFIQYCAWTGSKWTTERLDFPKT